MRDKKTQKHAVSIIGQILKNEVKNLCSRRAKSMQRLHNASTLEGFNWDSVIEEATEHAPNLIQILTECTRKSPKQPEAEQKSMVGICYANTEILR